MFSFAGNYGHFRVPWYLSTMASNKDDKLSPPRKADAARAPDVVQVELDGPGVAPETVDAIALLRVAESYLWLVSRLGHIHDAPVTLTGIAIIDKCAAVQTWPTDMTRAVLFCQEAARVISGQEEAPHGAEKAAADAREALRGLPKTMKARVLAGKFVGSLVAPEEEALREHPWEQTQLRATLVRTGGKKPVAQFRSVDDGAFFTLDLPSEEAARELGQHLYKDVDLEALIVRDHQGGIEKGELIDLHVLSDAEPGDAWRTWFQKNAGEWAEVEDVLGELGRDDD